MFQTDVVYRKLNNLEMFLNHKFQLNVDEKEQAGQFEGDSRRDNNNNNNIKTFFPWRTCICSGADGSSFDDVGVGRLQSSATSLKTSLEAPSLKGAVNRVQHIL